MQQIANEYSIPFLNGCLYTDEIGLDYTLDSMGDGGHLNYSGATKYTKWLSEFLKVNYSLPDRRGDIRYRLWQNESNKLKAAIRRESLGKITDIKEYLEYIWSNELYFVISLNGDYYKDVEALCLDILSERDINIQKSGTYIINGNEKVFYSNGKNGYKYYKYFDDSVLYVYGDGNNHAIMWNGVLSTVVKNGINIFVYDKVLDEVVGKIGFDADENYKLVR